jgi:hypothetical protein
MIGHHGQTMPFCFLSVGNVEEDDCRMVVMSDWLMWWLLFDDLYWLMAVATWWL